MNMEEFGKSILSLRQNANMTQEELALRMGVTPQAISKWERGQSLPDISLFAQLCKALNVSADTLLGLEKPEARDDDGYPEEVLKNIRFSLEPLVLSFGESLLEMILETDYMELVAKQRIELSWEGILLPKVKLRDDLKLESDEFIIKIYDRVLHRERIATVNEDAPAHMIREVGCVVREHYGELLSRDLMRELTDNLKHTYPALIEGIVPEKISYGVLQKAYKRFLDLGNSPKYLPKIIEYLEEALYIDTEVSPEQLTEQICRRNFTSNNCPP